jgi:hypothetical protein
MAKIKAKGVVLKYGDTASPTTTLAQHTDVSVDLGQWDRNDVTTHTTTGSTKEYDTTLKEPVSVDVQGLLDPALADHAWLIGAHAAGTAKFFILVLPDAGAAEFVFSAQVTALSIGGLTPSGHITFSATLSGTTAAAFTA